MPTGIICDTSVCLVSELRDQDLGGRLISDPAEKEGTVLVRL